MSWLSLVVHSFTNVKKAGVHSVIRMVVGRSLDFFVLDSFVVLLFVFRSLVVRCSFIVRIGSFGSLAHSLFVHKSLFARCEWLVNGCGSCPCVKSTHRDRKRAAKPHGKR